MQTVRSNGQELLRYRSELVTVLRLCLHAACRDAAELAAQLLKHMLRALTVIYALDYRSVPAPWDKPLSEYLPIRVRHPPRPHPSTTTVRPGTSRSPSTSQSGYVTPRPHPSTTTVRPGTSRSPSTSQSGYVTP